MSLTGGTGDVNPQLLSFNAVQSSADATTTTTQTLPVEKFGSSRGGKARIIEILKIYYQFNNAVALEADSLAQCFISTTSFGTTATNFAEPRVLSYAEYNTRITTSGQINTFQPFVQDLTDGAGHGVLVATDNIFAQVVSTTTSATNTVRIKILYRFKAVGITEYVGIVQSQQ